MKNRIKNQKSGIRQGFSLVEVIVASSIITASILGIVGVYTTFLKHNFNNTPTLQAAYLADEGTEAIKSMRDFGWNSNIATLTVGTPYRLAYNNTLNKWQATTSTALIDSQFDRTFTLGNAYRDGNANLASSGTLDTNTRLVTVNVSWYTRTATTTKTIVTYISNLFDN